MFSIPVRGKMQFEGEKRGRKPYVDTGPSPILQIALPKIKLVL